MKWPRRNSSGDTRRPNVADDPLTEAVIAAEQARERLMETRAARSEVIRLTQRLAEIRKRNHFQEAIRKVVLDLGGD